MPFAKSTNCDIWYECYGKDQTGTKPALVFAHGAGGNGLSWFQQVPYFARDFHVCVFEHRGFGRSTCETSNQSGRYFAHDLIAVLDAAKIDRAVIVCQSMGGWTGVLSAVARPDRIAGVFLANTPGAIHTEEVVSNWEQMRQRLAAAGGLVNRAISEEFAQRSPAGDILYRQISALNVNATPNLREEGIQVTPDVIRELPVQFFVLYSDLDPLFPPELLRSVAKQIGAKSALVRDAGHSTYFEKPEAFNSVLDSFLQDLDLL